MRTPARPAVLIVELSRFQGIDGLRWSKSVAAQSTRPAAANQLRFRAFLIGHTPL